MRSGTHCRERRRLCRWVTGQARHRALAVAAQKIKIEGRDSGAGNTIVHAARGESRLLPENAPSSSAADRARPDTRSGFWPPVMR
jgi:hypothetical protein